MISLYLNKEFRKHWQNKDVFQNVHLLNGEIYRQVAARRTLRFKLGMNYYFAKIHYGVGWFEIVKNLITLRMPVLGAENEWRAISRLKKLDIATMTPVAYGIKGRNPANLFSFIITEELINTVSLEDLCAQWVNTPPDYSFKKRLIFKVANISRVMHEHGINHRDFYICHFLLDREILGGTNGEELKLYLIDLHRAQLRNKTPKRWLVKDIGGLYFSAMEIGLTHKDIYRFMKTYFGRDLRSTLSKDSVFWRLVEKRAISLYIKANGHRPKNLLRKLMSH